MWRQVMNGGSSSVTGVSTYCFGFIVKDKSTWSVIKRGWVGLENNGPFPLSVAICVEKSPLNSSSIINFMFLVF